MKIVCSFPCNHYNVSCSTPLRLASTISRPIRNSSSILTHHLPDSTATHHGNDRVLERYQRTGDETPTTKRRVPCLVQWALSRGSKHSMSCTHGYLFSNPRNSRNWLQGRDQPRQRLECIASIYHHVLFPTVLQHDRIHDSDSNSESSPTPAPPPAKASTSPEWRISGSEQSAAEEPPR